MIKQILIGLSLILCVSIKAQSIKIGSGVLHPNNKQISLKAVKSARKTNDIRYEVMRFSKLPNRDEVNYLKSKGITLLSYIQDKLYYVTVSDEASYHKMMRRSNSFNEINILDVYNVDPLWKISSNLDRKNIPVYAQAGPGMAKLNLQYFENTDSSLVEKTVLGIGASVISHQKEFSTLTVSLDLKYLNDLASVRFIKWIEYIGEPSQLDNVVGRSLSRSRILSSSQLGERGLNGEGMKVAIWDSSIQNHADLGNRITSMEYELNRTHGQHVSGTMLGAGIIDPKGKGVASKAKVLAWNLPSNSATNGLTTEEEMLKSVRDFGVSITQNSYGLPKKPETCLNPRDYEIGAKNLDFLVNKFPKLTHVFTSGNHQTKCLRDTNSRYGTSSKREKNTIIVGAVDQNGKMTVFSSWGPTKDGRIIPHVTGFGVDVYSTVYDNSYKNMSGTSMACPGVSGVMTLVYQRYKELYKEEPLASLAKAALLNTATDCGNAGPDYQNGYGLVNGVKTVNLLEKKQFIVDEVQQGESNSHVINVPAGVKKLRVMLVWTDKAGKANNKDLINDLDLTVNGIEPWVLDPSKPNNLAVRGIDRLNNQEQVTIDNPAEGTVNVSVNGFEIPSSGAVQQYSLVYHFEKEELSVVYPRGGEKFNPGDKVFLMCDSHGYTGKKSFEISFDGGQTYSMIKSDVSLDESTVNYTIPNIVTDKALVRVVQNGTSAKSFTSFSIMHTPQNLKVTSIDECGTSNELTWDEVYSAVTYKILKADVDNGTYSEIATATAPSFILPDAHVQSARNIFSVVAVSQDGVESERAYAVIVNKSHPIDLANLKLPFNENFYVTPSTKMKVIKGSGVDVTYLPSSFTKDNSNLFSTKGNKVNKWISTGNVFDNNPENVSKLRICDLDATTHSDNLWLKVTGTLNKDKDGDARMRVLVAGKTIKGLNGVTEITSFSEEEQIKYWNLSSVLGGSKKSVEIQSVVKGDKDVISIGHIKIFKPIKDVSIEFTAPLVSKSLTNAETITVTINNNSGLPISDLPVSYQVNTNKEITEFIAQTIKPFEKLTYNFVQKVDMSTKNIVFEITTKVVLPGDEKPENNKVIDSTVNVSGYHLMPSFLAVENKIIAKVIPEELTDTGGKLLNYASDHSGFTVIEPENGGSPSNKKAKIKFTSLDLEVNDKISIYSGDNNVGEVLLKTITSEDKFNLPLEYVSESKSGKLYVFFKSAGKDTKPGWVAQVYEGDDPVKEDSNSFSLEFGENSINNGDYATAPQDVTLKIINNSGGVQNNVTVRYRINGGVWFTDVIPTVSILGESHTFSEQITMPAEQTFTVEAEILNEDSFMSDNVIRKNVISDYYCVSKLKRMESYRKADLCISEVAKDEVINKTGLAKSSQYPQYFRDIKFKVYKDLVGTNNIIKVTLGKMLPPKAKVNLWVDWDSDNAYDITPVATIVVKKSQKIYELPIEIPDSAVEGEYSMRISAIYANSTDPCYGSLSQSVAYGETEDYTLEVLNNYPISRDLSLVSSPMVGGSNLSANSSVSVLIMNSGSTPMSNFDISYKLNDNNIVSEKVTTELPAFSTLLYTFNKEEDLSVSGMYRFKFNVNDPTDQRDDNNQLIKEVLNEDPKDLFVALDFDGVDDALDLGDLGNKNLRSSTYEVWINPKSYGGSGTKGSGSLFEGKNAMVYLHGKGNRRLPEHCLVVVGNGGVWFTSKNSITLNRWQHVSVTYDSEAKQVKVYIDGISIPLRNVRPMGKVKNNESNKLFVGNNRRGNKPFDGMIDQIRIWDVVRTDDEILSNIHNTAVTGSGLVAEYKISEGYYNTKVYSSVGDLQGSILKADVSDDPIKSIWKIPVVDFNSFMVSNQLQDFENVSANHIISEVNNTSDITKVISTYGLNMKGVSVKIQGVNQVSSVTANDYTNSTSIPVEYVLSATHLGRKLTNTVRVGLKKGLSSESDLLTFGISSIPLVVSSISQDISMVVPGSIDVTNLRPQFTVSSGAKVFVNDIEVVPGVTSFDFSRPIVFKVLAANKKVYKLYAISLLKSNFITWVKPLLMKTYGDPDFTLEATSSIPNGKLSFKSSNSSVIKIENNKAIIKGSGESKITVSGIGSLSDAAEVSYTFRVAKAKLTVIAKDETIKVSDEIPPLKYVYSGFVYNEDETDLEQEPSVSTTAVTDSLSGSYIITLSGGSADNYIFKLVNGVLTIEGSEILSEGQEVRRIYAISPNADDANDFWVIEGNNSLNKYSVSLYNRNGRLVYESMDYKNDFEGIDEKGRILQTGSYVFIMTYTVNGKLHVIKDWLYIKN